MSSAASKLQSITNYPWPRLPHISHAPRWTGRGFVGSAEGEESAVLLYEQTDSHWSEELTELHETEAGDGDHPIDRASRALALQSIRRYAPAGPVLDVGCSSGFFLRDIREQLPDIPVIGADYIAGPLHKLARILPGVPLLQFDLRNCPLPSDSLGGIVCLNVLEHIDRDEAALAQMYRILQPGGVAHVEVPASPSSYDIYDEHLMHHRRYTMRELRAKAERSGFRLLSQTHLGALVFPAFYAVKRRNRRLLTLPPEKKAALVRKMMRSTRRSGAMELAMRAELLFGRIISYPVGIRCVAVLQKS